ncbi:hypothetical protein EON62_04395 [archaeon]|nr:MAG: hypothetical protein EON62_04395 [archaeon]
MQVELQSALDAAREEAAVKSRAVADLTAEAERCRAELSAVMNAAKEAEASHIRSVHALESQVRCVCVCT